MSSTEPTRTICQPWAAIPDLPAGIPSLSDDDWTALLWQASELLYSFSGKQFSGACESTVEIRERPRRHRRGWVASDLYGGTDALGSPLSSVAGTVGWAARGALVAALPGRPITGIVEATLGGEAVALEADLPAGLVYRADGRPWPTDGSAVITYTHGIAPPVGGRRSAVLLAVELGKAWKTGKSNLPARIETVSRENVTISMDPTFKALDKGRTGLFAVDAWLRDVNPHGFTAPPTVVSPDAARTRRKVIP